jgi:hypothetical protein
VIDTTLAVKINKHSLKQDALLRKTEAPEKVILGVVMGTLRVGGNVGFGEEVGIPVGMGVGIGVGARVGDRTEEGALVGVGVGALVGVGVGALVGVGVGMGVGTLVGVGVGCAVGTGCSIRYGQDDALLTDPAPMYSQFVSGNCTQSSQYIDEPLLLTRNFPATQRRLQLSPHIMLCTVIFFVEHGSQCASLVALHGLTKNPGGQEILSMEEHSSQCLPC